jgi:ABC-type uncharacterized transport system YnjBCD substrate-binding protein
LKRIPLNFTSEAVETVYRTVASGEPGKIDLIWINGHNFRASRQPRCAGSRDALATALRWQPRCDE